MSLNHTEMRHFLAEAIQEVRRAATNASAFETLYEDLIKPALSSLRRRRAEEQGLALVAHAAAMQQCAEAVDLILACARAEAGEDNETVEIQAIAQLARGLHLQHRHMLIMARVLPRLQKSHKPAVSPGAFRMAFV